MAIEELQLHDLKNMEAKQEQLRWSDLNRLQAERHEPAVDVKQNATPARHDDAMVPNAPARGIENRIPIAEVVDRMYQGMQMVVRERKSGAVQGAVCELSRSRQLRQHMIPGIQSCPPRPLHIVKRHR